jgi:D-alanine--poly(phosphoribitol) ligase subunit 1
MLVVDDQLRPVSDGDVGELLVRGATVMSGYWADPERNRGVLVRRPVAGSFEDVYFRTGDRVRTLPDGNLTFVARSDFQVKIRGHRVELEEVEAALLRLDAVEEAAAFTTGDGEGSSTLRAAVVVAAGRVTARRELRARVRDLLPPYAVPEEISILPAMPRTPTGKVDRDALKGAPTAAEEQHDG